MSLESNVFEVMGQVITEAHIFPLTINLNAVSLISLELYCQPISQTQKGIFIGDGFFPLSSVRLASNPPILKKLLTFGHKMLKNKFGQFKI